MNTNDKIKQDIQSLDAGSPLVDLIEIDATHIGGAIYRITPDPLDGGPVIFDAKTYTPLPVAISGVEMSKDGKLPRPKLTFSNINKALQAEVYAYNDFYGAKVTYYRTFKKYLDGQGEADPAAIFPKGVFVIKRKLRQNPEMLQFELRSPLDLESVMLPAGQVLPTCGLTYRVWTGAEFDYSSATCPYTDTDYFDATGNPTTADRDSCGLDLYSCRMRFPSTNNPDTQLPMDGFPGVGTFGAPYRK